jgi:hypothetical protein
MAGDYILSLVVNDGKDSSEESTMTITVTPPSTIKRTGQNKSYDAGATEITDGSIKDDGYYQSGVVSNYNRDDITDIVTDTVTGLEWEDDGAVIENVMTWLTTDNYNKCKGLNGETEDSSKCFDTSGETPTSYCSAISLGNKTDWRLPTIDELIYISDKSIAYHAISSVFKNIQYGEYAFYWSSSTTAYSDSSVWRAFFSYGSDYPNAKNQSGTTTTCVRGTYDTTHIFTRNNDIVSDDLTHLQWQDNSEAITITKNWEEAIEYCEALTLGGKTDWRLPNINELYYLADRSKFNPTIDEIFQNITDEDYWASTSDSTWTGYGWSVDFYDGTDATDSKDNSTNVRCVRAGL